MHLKTIKVLVVEDSPVTRDLLVRILDSDPVIKVIGTAASGEAAIEFVQRQKPDLITMDMEMPGLDGLEATRRIMQTAPVPIIILSGSWQPGMTSRSFSALEVGAVGVIAKPGEDPDRPGQPEIEPFARKLLDTVKAMAEVRVVRQWATPMSRQALPRAERDRAQPAPAEPGRARKPEVRLVAIGASTGGPPALKALLQRLPASFPAPIVVVQHISSGFLEGFADWLRGTVSLSVRIAENGERVQPGCVYLAPDGAQMGVTLNSRIILESDLTNQGICPSVSYLFQSVAANFGANAAGVLLTGMGRDGAAELRMMKERGALTFAQDSVSSIVHGMPGEAILLGGASYILPPEEIADGLERLICVK